MDVGHLALGVGALLAAGIGASLLAGRLRLPGLVLVLAVGMLLGDDVLGWIHFGETFADNQAAQNAAILALALILFEGGLSSGWAEIRPVIGVSITLATLGTLLTAALAALVAAWLFGELTTLEALLLGSTVAATDAAAVFAVLRGSTLRRRIARTLEGESGVNDPVAVLLVLGCIEAIKHPDFGVPDAIWLAVKELSIGAGAGLAAGALGVTVLRRLTLPTAGLYPVASLALAGIAYGGAVFAFAGLYDRTGAAIVTGPANEVCAPVHDRMPCVLADPDAEAAWLSGDVAPEEAAQLLGPLPSERVSVAPANPAVNKAGVEGLELLTAP